MKNIKEERIEKEQKGLLDKIIKRLVQLNNSSNNPQEIKKTQFKKRTFQVPKPSSSFLGLSREKLNHITSPKKEVPSIGHYNPNFSMIFKNNRTAIFNKSTEKHSPTKKTPRICRKFVKHLIKDEDPLKASTKKIEEKDVDFQEKDICKYTHSKFPRYVLYYTKGQYMIDPKHIPSINNSSKKFCFSKSRKRYSIGETQSIPSDFGTDSKFLKPSQHLPKIEFKKMGEKKLDWYFLNKQTCNLFYDVTKDISKISTGIKFKTMPYHNIEKFFYKPCFHSEMDITNESEKGYKATIHKNTSFEFSKMLSRVRKNSGYASHDYKDYSPTLAAKLAILELKQQIEKKHNIQLP